MWISLLVGTAIKGTLLLAFLYVVTTGLRRSPAAIRHLLWSSGFAGLLLLLPLSGAIPWRISVPSVPFTLDPVAAWTTPAGSGDRIGPERVVEEPVGDLGAAQADRSGSDRVHEGAASSDAAGPTGSPSIADPRAPVSNGSASGTGPVSLLLSALPDRIHPVLLLWLVGALLVSGYLLLESWAVRSIVRKGDPAEDARWRRLLDAAALRIGEHGHIRLIVSPAASIPFATGIVRPTIVLPRSAEGWSDDRCSAVLLHELAHVRRRDLLPHLLSRIASALYWFNPLVWIAARRLRAESERACDDLVLDAGARPSQYARHLIEVVRTTRRSWAVGAAQPMARHSEFEGRLLAILAPDARRSRPKPGIAAALALCVASSAVPLAAMGPSGADSRHTAEASSITGVELPVERGLTPTDLPKSGESIDPEMAQVFALPDGGSDETAVLRDDSRASPAIADEIEPLPEVVAEPGTLEPESAGLRVEVLIGALRDDDRGVRVAVVAALGSLKDTLAVNALVRALREDPDAEVRVAAAHALGEIGDARAVPALGAALREDEAPAVRVTAARALGDIEDPRAVDALGAALGDGDIEVRKAAIHALGEIESPDAIPALTPALRDGDSGIRQLAARALGEIEDARAVEALGSVLTSDESVPVRVQAARALGEIEHGSGVQALSAALEDPDPEVRRMAVWALGEIEDARAVEPLVGVLTDADVELRRGAAQALAEIEDARAVEPLVAALRDSDAGVRLMAARALGEIEDPRAGPGLVEALGDGDVRVRLQATRSLGEIDLRAAPPALIARLEDENPQVRHAAAEALGDIEDPAAVPGLAALLDDPLAELRRAAIEALADIEHPSAYEILVRALEDEDPQIRRMAAHALGKS